MPLRLNVGVNKKIGLPDYGSLGTFCSVDVEVEGYLLFDDLETFHQKARQAYIACAQAVNDELARQQASVRQATKQTVTHPDNQANGASHAGIDTTSGNGHRNGANGSGANGNSVNGNGASQRQIDYANQLASHIEGLGVRRLDALASARFGKPIAGLSCSDASALIDTLKAIKDGRIDLNAVLEGEIV